MCSLLQKFKLDDREWGIFGPSPNFIKTEARHDFLGRLLAFFDNKDNALHIESILHKVNALQTFIEKNKINVSLSL